MIAMQQRRSWLQVLHYRLLRRVVNLGKHRCSNPGAPKLADRLLIKPVADECLGVPVQQKDYTSSTGLHIDGSSVPLVCYGNSGCIFALWSGTALIVSQSSGEATTSHLGT